MKRIIDRFDVYMTSVGLNDNKVTVQLGLSKGLIGKSRGVGRDLSRSLVEKILAHYTDLNGVWLLTGEGQMLTESPVSLPDPEPTPASDMAMVNRLLQLLEEKERSHAALLEILKEKDETIRQLIIEITALKEKRGDAKNVITSSDANVG